MTAGGCVQCDVDGGAIGIGVNRALVDGEVCIRVAQYQGSNAAAFEFLAQAVGQRDRDIFLGESIAQSFSVIAAAVAGVDDRKIAPRRRDGRRRRVGCGGSWLRRGRRSSWR